MLTQNLFGNNPKCWDRRNILNVVLSYRQYKVQVDVSRRISSQNRKSEGRFEHLVSEKRCGIPTQVLPETEVEEPTDVPSQVTMDEDYPNDTATSCPY